MCARAGGADVSAGGVSRGWGTLTPKRCMSLMVMSTYGTDTRVSLITMLMSPSASGLAMRMAVRYCELTDPLSEISPPGSPSAITYANTTHTIQQNSCTPEANRLNFSMYQSGIDFKCPYSSRLLTPLTRLLGLWQGLFMVLENPLINLIRLCYDSYDAPPRAGTRSPWYKSP
jgi:hypothetical protein